MKTIKKGSGRDEKVQVMMISELSWRQNKTTTKATTETLTATETELEKRDEGWHDQGEQEMLKSTA